MHLHSTPFFHWFSCRIKLNAHFNRSWLLALNKREFIFNFFVASLYFIWDNFSTLLLLHASSCICFFFSSKCRIKREKVSTTDCWFESKLHKIVIIIGAPSWHHYNHDHLGLWVGLLVKVIKKSSRRKVNKYFVQRLPVLNSKKDPIKCKSQQVRLVSHSKLIRKYMKVTMAWNGL